MRLKADREEARKVHGAAWSRFVAVQVAYLETLPEPAATVVRQAAK